MKRKPGESFEAYKKRRKKEQKLLKSRMRGNVIWNSSNVIQRPGGDITELMKIRNQGTFRKPKAEYDHKLNAAKKAEKEKKKNAKTES